MEEGIGEESMSVPATGDTEALRSRFVAEAIAAIGEADRYDKAQEAFREWLYSLAPFSRWGGTSRVLMRLPFLSRTASLWSP